ncbi:hypothetical protein [Tabrizicola fusiformis]|uniref:hypothetical protein n=1 Tax=Tabrizicola sp. SY72 TaxID=2741673 RepID=UPI0015734745|nr:hypothetical protein [Tabrizicola sp. SY72]NTT84716.1 hypothetical protein [Tabrizicola sp. SY72]
MPLSDLLLSQLADPFRIGLLLALIVTMQRTRAATGVWLPLAAGALFVAVIIPVTAQRAGLPLPLWQVVAVGVVANVILLAIALAAWEAYRRLRG